MPVPSSSKKRKATFSRTSLAMNLAMGIIVFYVIFLIFVLPGSGSSRFSPPDEKRTKASYGCHESIAVHGDNYTYCSDDWQVLPAYREAILKRNLFLVVSAICIGMLAYCNHLWKTDLSTRNARNRL